MKKNHPQQPWILKYATLICLTLVMILGAVLRFSQLSSLPSALNRDEAALAYNAFLLKQTGKDEWGRSWPVALESFGDYKLPGYPLLLIGSFTIFGVNDFAVRFPSAAAGTLLILVGYFFAKKILNLQSWTSVFVAGTIALQPIFFFYSRMAWEANVALLFFTVSITLLLSRINARREPWKVDALALLFLVLAIFTYNTPLLLIPFIGLALMLQRGLRNWKSWIFPVVGMIVVFVIGIVAFSSISQQKSGITIFSDETLWRESVVYYDSYSGISQKILGNRYVFFGRIIVEHGLASIGPNFLVQRGGQHPWHSLPNTGHIYLATYLLSIVALLRLGIVLIDKKSNTATKVTALMLLFLGATSLAPSLITVDAPHATRSLFFFFLVCTFSGIAIELLWKMTSVKDTRRALLQLIFAMLLLFGGTIEVRNYFTKYFSLYPQQSASILKAGLGEQLSKMEKRLGSSADQVAVVDPDGFLYVTAAWELKMSPEKYFATINHHLPDRIGLKYGYRVGRYRFIAKQQDRVPEDKHIIEWYQGLGQWVTDQNL